MGVQQRDYEVGEIRTDRGLLIDKGNQRIDVRHRDFEGGAKPGGLVDCTRAINAAAEHYRSIVRAGDYRGNAGTNNPHIEQAAPVLYFGPGVYRVDGTLWFGADLDNGADFTAFVKNIQCHPGAIIVSYNADGVAIDFAGGYNPRWRGLTLFGDATDAPKVGILFARSGSSNPNPSSGSGKLVDCRILGNYTLANIFSYGSEINDYHGCELRNAYDEAHCVIETTRNEEHSVTSPNTTIGTGYQSHYGSRWHGGEIRHSGEVSATSSVYRLESAKLGPKFFGTYFDTANEQPIIRMVDATGASGTDAQNQGTALFGVIVENGYSSIVTVEHEVRHLTMRGCSFAGTPGVAHVEVTTTGALRGTDIQTFTGNTSATGTGLVTYSLTGSAVAEKRARAFYLPDTPATHYTINDLTADGAFHVIDLTANAQIEPPAGAKFVIVRVRVRNTGTVNNSNKFIMTDGDESVSNGQRFEVNPPVQSIDFFAEGWVPLNADGEIAYSLTSGYTVADICVRGYVV